MFAPSALEVSSLYHLFQFILSVYLVNLSSWLDANNTTAVWFQLLVTGNISVDATFGMYWSYFWSQYHGLKTADYSVEHTIVTDSFFGEYLLCYLSPCSLSFVYSNYLSHYWPPHYYWTHHLLWTPFLGSTYHITYHNLLKQYWSLFISGHYFSHY